VLERNSVTKEVPTYTTPPHIPGKILRRGSTSQELRQELRSTVQSVPNAAAAQQAMLQQQQRQAQGAAWLEALNVPRPMLERVEVGTRHI